MTKRFMIPTPSLSDRVFSVWRLRWRGSNQPCGRPQHVSFGGRSGVCVCLRFARRHRQRGMRVYFLNRTREVQHVASFVHAIHSSPSLFLSVLWLLGISKLRYVP